MKLIQNQATNYIVKHPNLALITVKNSRYAAKSAALNLSYI